MRRIKAIYWCLFALILTACVEENFTEDNSGNTSSVSLISKTFSATLEGGCALKSSLQDGADFGKVYWEKGDQMTILALAGGEVSTYAFSTDDEGPAADFTNKDGVALASDYYAVYPDMSGDRYPYVKKADGTGYGHDMSSDATLSMVLQSSQPSSIGATTKFNALTAGKVEADGETLHMKNVCGLISFNIADTDITSVTLYGNSGETLAGKLTAAFNEHGIPVVSSTEGSNMVRIVPLKGSTFNPGTYYFTIPPTEFKEGLTLLFTNSSSQFATLVSNDSFVVKRSSISPLPEGTLAFGGRVVELTFIKDIGSFTRPFGSAETLPSSSDAQKALSGKVNYFDYKIDDNSCPVSIYASTLLGVNSGSLRGLLFGRKVGDYLELPAVDGFALSKVIMRNAAQNRPSGSPAIVSSDGDAISGGDAWADAGKLQGLEHIWNLDVEPGERCRLMLTDNSECNIQQLRLFYAPSDETANITMNVIDAGGTFHWPFDAPARENMTTSYSEPVMADQKVTFALNEKYGKHEFDIYASGGFSINSGKYNGLRIHGTKSGDYILFPAIEGKYLTKVEVVTGESGVMRYPSITNAEGTENVSGGGAMGLSFGGHGERHIWKLSGTEPGVRYRMTFNQTGVACIQRLILTFSDKPRIASEEDNKSYPSEDDIIPDFSRVGYMWGDKPIPDYDVVTILTPPAAGSDATQLIQNAIDAMQGTGAILLKAGTYNVSGSILLNKSGVVLRGEGSNTIIKATGTSDRNLIEFGLRTSQQLMHISASEIITPRLAVGQLRVPVKEPWKFSVGDRVVIWRPATYKWLDDLKMTQIPQNSENRVIQWDPADYNLTWERTVTAIEGDYIHIDNPVVMETSYEYGGGWLMRCSWDRISGSGIENMHLDTEFNAAEVDSKGRLCDEDHAWSAVIVRAAEHCWVRGVSSSHFAFATVYNAVGAKNITVEDCHGYTPVSEIAGSRRYAFQYSGAQLCLVKDCTCEYDRHAFATSHARTTGPNVFLRCSATNMYGDIGPHVGWTTGVLYDNVKTDSQYIAVQDRHNTAEGHGWAGVNFVLYNCEAPGIICQNPWVTGKNYAIGCVGVKYPHNRTNVDASFSRPDGEWVSAGVHVTPVSLYEDSLEKRHKNGIYIAK